MMCDHDYICIVPGYFDRKKQMALDYLWCKKCGAVKVVTTRDGEIVTELRPDPLSNIPYLSPGGGMHVPVKCVNCKHLNMCASYFADTPATVRLCNLVNCYYEEIHKAVKS